jgi:ATP-dependent RNA helicase RhlE
VLAAFRAGHVRTLIATDIAARGLDVEGISHVVNYDLPNIPESYVHRIGRTARAGADGVAISFCDSEERAFLRDIEKLIRMAIPATHHGRAQHVPAARHTQRANGAAAAPPPSHRHENRKRQQQARGDQKPARRANGHQHRSERSPTASDGGIGAIAFMQPKRGSRRQSSRHFAQRAPR